MLDVLELAQLMLPPEVQALDPWQREVLLSDEQENFVNVHRQGGKSEIVAAKSLIIALTEPDSLILCVSRSFRQALELGRKVRACLHRYQKHLQIKNPSVDVSLGLLTDNKAEFELPNNSRVVCLPPNEETIRGYSKPRCILLDEASRIPDEVYLCLRPMCLTSPKWQIWLLSTPFGQRGFFWQESRNPTFKPWTWTIQDGLKTGRISPKFVKDEQKRGDLYFRQEFMCEFLSNVECLFSRPELEAAIGTDAPILELYECISQV